jgi:hypothetical protein
LACLTKIKTYWYNFDAWKFLKLYKKNPPI